MTLEPPLGDTPSALPLPHATTRPVCTLVCTHPLCLQTKPVAAAGVLESTITRHSCPYPCHAFAEITRVAAAGLPCAACIPTTIIVLESQLMPLPTPCVCRDHPGGGGWCACTPLNLHYPLYTTCYTLPIHATTRPVICRDHLGGSGWLALCRLHLHNL